MLYIVFDRRAHIDIDDAKMLKYLGEMEPEQAYKEFMESWKDTDAALVEYDIIDGEADHPVVVPIEEIKNLFDQS